MAVVPYKPQNFLTHSMRKRLSSPEMQVYESIEDYIVALARHYPGMKTTEVVITARQIYESRDRIPAARKELESRIGELDREHSRSCEAIDELMKTAMPKRPINPFAVY